MRMHRSILVICVVLGVFRAPCLYSEKNENIQVSFSDEVERVSDDLKTAFDNLQKKMKSLQNDVREFQERRDKMKEQLDNLSKRAENMQTYGADDDESGFEKEGD